MFDFVLSSPPYADEATNGARANRAKNLESAGIDSKRWLGKRRCTQGRSEGYGHTDGQLGAMKADMPYTCPYCRQPVAPPLNYHEGPEDCRVTTDVPVTVWEGCYDTGWKGVCSSASFSHPAKFARGLVQRIYQHMLERGWLRKGDTVLDVFGGCALGGIVAAYHDIQWVGIELEPRFVGFAQENIALHRAKWSALGAPVPVILQGDSRRAVELVGKAMADGVLSSPPYANEQIQKNSKSIDRTKQHESYRAAGGGASFEAFCATQDKHSGHYGTTEGQLGSMAEGTISSPPFMNQQTGGGIAKNGTPGQRLESKNPIAPVGYQNQGSTPGQLGGMAEGVVSSPPYAGVNLNPGEGQRPDVLAARLEAEGKHDAAAMIRKNGMGPANGLRQGDYGTTPGQLGGMAEGVVSSPPYAESMVGAPSEETVKKRNASLKKAAAEGKCGPRYQQMAKTEKFCGSTNQIDYGATPGQLGGMPEGETQRQPLDAAIASPPFGSSQTSTEASQKQKASGYFEKSTNGTLTGAYAETPMATPGQLGAMDASVSSPPYADSVHDGNGIDSTKLTGNKPGANSQVNAEGYGTTPGQLGGMAEGVVSSPPYEASLHLNESAEKDITRMEKKNLVSTIRKHGKNSRCGNKGYDGRQDSPADPGTPSGTAAAATAAGDAENLGNESGETFWSAARLILLQTHALLKDGGVAAWVCKDYCRAGKRVFFSRQWLALCEACGFELVEWVNASLVKNTKSRDVFGGEVEDVKARKSFFRRLFESKLPKGDERRIDEENVIFVRRIARTEDYQHGQHPTD